MKTVTYKGFLYVDHKGTPQESYCLYRYATMSDKHMQLVMPLNFEVQVPDDDEITPVTVLAENRDESAICQHHEPKKDQL